MSLHLDGPSAIALVLAVGAALGLSFFRRRFPQRSVGMEVTREPGRNRLTIRISNRGLPGLTLDEVGFSCSDRQPYTGKAWGTGHSGLGIHLEPGAPPAELWLDYPLLLAELHRGGVSLRDAWAVDRRDRIYTCRVPVSLLREMMLDMQKLNVGEG